MPYCIYYAISSNLGTICRYYAILVDGEQTALPPRKTPQPLRPLCPQGTHINTTHTHTHTRLHTHTHCQAKNHKHERLSRQDAGQVLQSSMTRSDNFNKIKQLELLFDSSIFVHKGFTRLVLEYDLYLVTLEAPFLVNFLRGFLPRLTLATLIDTYSR